MLSFIWGSQGKTFLQIASFCFGVGGIIAPLATVNFLIDESYVEALADKNVMPAMNMLTSNASVVSYANSAFLNILEDHDNWSTNVLASEFDNDTLANGIDNTGQIKPESKLYQSYLITASMVIISAIPFLYFAINSHNKSKEKTSKQVDENKAHRPSRKIPLYLKACLVALVGGMYAMSCGAEDTFNSFLTAFVVEYLGWTKSNGSFAAVVYWIFFCIGRFSGIFIVHFIRLSRVLFGFISFLIISSLSFVLCSYYHITIGVWISCGCIGVGSSITFVTAYSWIEETLFPVTAKMAAVIFISASTSAVINPVILGFLMEEETPMWFPYIIVGENAMFMVFFVSLVLLSKYTDRIYGKYRSGHHELSLNIEVDIEQKKTFIEN